MAHPAAVLVGAHVQALVQSGFDAPIITLPLQPLAGGQSVRGARLVSKYWGSGWSPKPCRKGIVRTLGRSWKTGLLRVNDCRAERADFVAAPILLWPRVRPLRRQRLWRGKKAAPVWAAVGPASGAVLFGWP